MKRTTMCSAFLALMLIGAGLGCDQRRVEAAGSTTAPAAPVIFDAGDISLDGDRAVVSHSFPVVNATRGWLELSVVSSCGCLEARVEKERLAPRESTTLHLSMELTHAGRASYAAWVVRSDGNVDQFVLAANGTMSQDFTVFLRQPRLDENSHIDVRAYLVDSTGDGEPHAPSLVSPEGVRVVEATWITLEHDLKRRRPTRQVGTITLDFSEYTSEFPVEVRLRTPSGLESSVTVDG